MPFLTAEYYFNEVTMNNYEIHYILLFLFLFFKFLQKRRKGKRKGKKTIKHMNNYFSSLYL